MAILLSKPLSLSIVAHSFGQGSNAGSLQNGVWTPGRDANGVVNQVSWDAVPSGTWVRVAGTEMNTLTDTIMAARLSWDSSSLNWAGYTQSWSGWGVDIVGSRVWAFSGGHSDGNNNGLYRFDGHTMRWAIEQLPTDRALQNAEYAGGQGTGNGAAWQAALAKYARGALGHINDDWYDQFMANKQPTARHTYGSMVYDPAADRVHMAVRRWWSFNRASGTWDYRRVFNDNPHSAGLPDYMDGECVTATWDEVTGEALFSSAGSMALNRSLGFRPSDQTWRSFWAPWNGWGNVADTRVGRHWTVVSPPTETGPFTGKYWHYNLDTRSLTKSGDFQYVGCSRAEFPPIDWYYDGASVTYVVPAAKYLMCTMTRSTGMRFFWIDPATAPWTVSPAVMDNAPADINMLLNRRMVHLPVLNAVVLQNLGSTPIYLHKF